jgi:Zn-dependent M32 family carboxypeptidase
MDDYDAGMRTAVAARLLGELRGELLPLIKKVEIS